MRNEKMLIDDEKQKFAFMERDFQYGTTGGYMEDYMLQRYYSANLPRFLESDFSIDDIAAGTFDLERSCTSCAGMRLPITFDITHIPPLDGQSV